MRKGSSRDAHKEPVWLVSIWETSINVQTFLSSGSHGFLLRSGKSGATSFRNQSHRFCTERLNSKLLDFSLDSFLFLIMSEFSCI